MCKEACSSCDEAWHTHSVVDRFVDEQTCVGIVSSMAIARFLFSRANAQHSFGRSPYDASLTSHILARRFFFVTLT